MSLVCLGFVAGCVDPQEDYAWSITNDTSRTVAVSLCTDRACDGHGPYSPLVEPGHHATIGFNPSKGYSIGIYDPTSMRLLGCIPVGISISGDSTDLSVARAESCAVAAKADLYNP